MSDLLVRGGTVVDVEGCRPADVLVRGETIREVGPGLAGPQGAEILDAQGLFVLPGLIDSHVHFREPGHEDSEDLATGPLAAVAGGITAFCEMPNTTPPTTDPERLADKLERATGRARADFAFYLGATTENADRLGEWEQLPGCAGIKIFAGSSTGSLLVRDDETIERVLRSGRRRVAVHAEDDYRLEERYGGLTGAETPVCHPDVRDVESALLATRRILDLAEKTGRRVHVLHVSTAEEIELFRERDLGELATCEVTPNHLFLVSPECYARHGSGAMMNPPVRDRRHMETLREATADGTVACIGSDHAPHTPEEKARPFPCCSSGIPGVQTTLALLLTAVRDGWLRLEDLPRLLGTGPARTLGLRRKGRIAPGMDGDLALVDPAIRGPLSPEWLRTRIKSSPYEGIELAGWPVATILRGQVAYRDHGSAGNPRGEALEFDKYP